NIRIYAKEKGKIIRLSIQDNGVGMKAENIKKLFEIDVHHSTPGTNEEKGTGLGLILSKEFLKYHETNDGAGKIFVESSLGVGSVFTITLSKTSKH
ncbi:MAG: HAMP domain-containing sensor histidine kinase, partial [Bacteroidota bacterium]